MTIVLEHPNPESPNPAPKPLSAISQRYDATWADYVGVRDNPELDCPNISFYDGWLFVDRGLEGPAHSSFKVYKTIEVSQILTGLPIALIEQTLERLETDTNTAAASWLMLQLQNRS